MHIVKRIETYVMVRLNEYKKYFKKNKKYSNINPRLLILATFPSAYSIVSIYILISHLRWLTTVSDGIPWEPSPVKVVTMTALHFSVVRSLWPLARTPDAVIV